MAQSQTFNIRNIVKKEALPRIIFSSFYIYMHVDGGELVMRADSWVVWWESARKLSRSARTKCVRRYGWTMPSLKVNFFLCGVWGTLFCSGYISVLHCSPLHHCLFRQLIHLLTHSFIHSFIHSFTDLFIHTFIGCPLKKAYRQGEITKAGRAPRLTFLKIVCTCAYLCEYNWLFCRKTIVSLSSEVCC